MANNAELIKQCEERAQQWLTPAFDEETRNEVKSKYMELYYTGVIIAISTFLIIGIFHPIVIKTEYHTGTRFWWVFLVTGIICIGAAFLVANVLGSALLGVVGASCLWSIGELFEQKERCEKGWFPKNPKLEKKGYYKK